MIKAAIFDLDGLLVDSGPLWAEASAKTFRAAGVPDNTELAGQTIGLRPDEEVHFWYSHFPWEHPSEAEIYRSYIQSVISLVEARAKAMPGAAAAVKLVSSKGLRLAVASSSPTEIIAVDIKKLGMQGKFDVIQSAEHEPYGKPHPGVYITAADNLGVRPVECLAFEDSLNGVLSAKAAGMKCVAVPDPRMKGDPRFAIADIVLGSLTEFIPAVLEKLL